MPKLNYPNKRKRFGTNNKPFALVFLFNLIIALISGFFFFGCKSSDIQNLEFKTFAQDFGFSQGEGYGEENPDVLVIASLEDIENPGLEVQFPPSLAEELRTVDYQLNFIIFIFRGLLTGTSEKYTIDITNVIKRDNKIVIQVHFGSPGPENLITFAFSSPYHAIVIPKDEEWNQDILFTLEVDGKKISQYTHFIP